MAKRKTASIDFEKSLAELEKLVETLERGDLPLDKTLAGFEAGIALARDCQRALAEAEQKVEILMEKNPDAEPQPFDEPDDG